jgi:hypothetical protein
MVFARDLHIKQIVVIFVRDLHIIEHKLVMYFFGKRFAY